MTTRIIVIVGASIATVVLLFVLGRMADGKSDDTEKKDTDLSTERKQLPGRSAFHRSSSAWL